MQALPGKHGLTAQAHDTGEYDHDQRTAQQHDLSDVKHLGHVFNDGVVGSDQRHRDDDENRGF